MAEYGIGKCKTICFYLTCQLTCIILVMFYIPYIYNNSTGQQFFLSYKFVPKWPDKSEEPNYWTLECYNHLTRKKTQKCQMGVFPCIPFIEEFSPNLFLYKDVYIKYCTKTWWQFLNEIIEEYYFCSYQNK